MAESGGRISGIVLAAPSVTQPETPMRRLTGFSAAVFLLASITACATAPIVSSHVRRDADFSRYRTYDWGPADALPAGDARLADHAFFRDYMQGAVDRHLASKGLERAEPGRAPDLLVHYHASVTERLDVDRLDRRYGYGSCSGGDCSGALIEFEAGTLVLDVADARTNRVIWRGWTQHRLADLLASPERMRSQIDRAVAQMLQRLPIPAPSASTSTGGPR
jgi:hypothetical protein